MFFPIFAPPIAAPISLKENLFGVDFADEQNGWAVGYYGKILHTADGGKTWTDQANGAKKVLSDVDFVDANTGWVVGYGPTILYTENVVRFIFSFEPCPLNSDVKRSKASGNPLSKSLAIEGPGSRS